MADSRLARPGDDLDLSAADWNEVRSMLAWWKRRRRSPDEHPGHNAFGAPQIWIKNTTSTALAAFTVLGIDQPILDLTDSSLEQEKFSGLRWDGIAPLTATPHYGQYAILQEPAEANDGFARAVMAGPTLAKVSITDAADRAAEITNNVTANLTTGYVGTSRILWKQSGTGSGKLALIRIGDTLDVFFGKPTGSIAAGGTGGTVNAWKPDFTGSALGPQITGCYNPGVALTSSDKVSGVVVAGIPVIGKIC